MTRKTASFFYELKKKSFNSVSKKHLGNFHHEVLGLTNFVLNQIVSVVNKKKFQLFILIYYLL